MSLLNKNQIEVEPQDSTHTQQSFNATVIIGQKLSHINF